MNYLRIEHLSFYYPGNNKRILNDLTFDIQEQKIVTLLGPNGSGKSTLLQILAKLEKKYEGLIKYDHRKLESSSLSIDYSQIGFMPQIEYINPLMTAFEYVLLGRSPYILIGKQPNAADKVITWNCLKQFNAQHFAYARMGEISGGQLQLIRLARVISQQAGLLLLDEPTTFLDLINRRQFISVIRELPAKGITVILATHDPEIIIELNSEVILLNRGEILAKGPQGRVINDRNLSQTFGYPIQVDRSHKQKVIM